jgi:hypothetical protein
MFMIKKSSLLIKKLSRERRKTILIIMNLLGWFWFP